MNDDDSNLRSYVVAVNAGITADGSTVVQFTDSALPILDA